MRRGVRVESLREARAERVAVMIANQPLGLPSLETQFIETNRRKARCGEGHMHAVRTGVTTMLTKMWATSALVATFAPASEVSTQRAAYPMLARKGNGSMGHDMRRSCRR